MIQLAVRGISKHFAGTRALSGVDLDIEPGTFHALVGENGAGKSTLGKILAGVIRPDAGEILWQGAPVSPRNPMDAQRLGIGIIFQELDLFPHLSIADNLSIANLAVERGRLLNRRALEQFATPLMSQVGLNASPWTQVSELSIGNRQLVAIARALGMNARLLIMDEPTSSLAGDHAERLFSLIDNLKSKGVSIVYVSHKMNEVFRLPGRITVLRDGVVVGTRSTRETSRAEVISMMVGRELANRTGRQDAPPIGAPLLRVNGLSSRKLKNISFELRAGEVLGVAGLVGAGRSSLGAALFGMHPISSGAIEIGGRPYRPKCPAHAIRNGFGLQPEDRKTEGLMMQMSVLENSSLSILQRLQRFGFVRSAEERRVACAIHSEVRLKAASPDSAMGTLSGGNQQKVLLARWLLVDPAVLILDDPTRGIDIAAKRDIYELIEKFAGRRKGVILISSELPELMHCSHRIMVLCDGKCAGIRDARSTTPEEIMALATSPAAA